MNEKLLEVIRRPSVISASVGVAAFCGGLGLGYFLCLQKSKYYCSVEETEETEDYDEDIFNSPVIQEIHEYLDMHHEPLSPQELYPKPDPDDISVDDDGLDKLNELVDKYGLEDGHKIFRVEKYGYSEDPLKDVVMNNVFAGSSDNWDYDVEVSNRTDKSPYVIHKDEFWSNEFDFAQTTLTYFQGDDILVDQSDTPIYNYETVVGELKFGHGSNDPNVFYVRNPKNRAEYEILLDRGSYSVEILGLDSEDDADIWHSVEKFKPDD